MVLGMDSNGKTVWIDFEILIYKDHKKRNGAIITILMDN